jgi:FdhD protein
MRTPGQEIEHAVGFCLAEGLIDAREDIKTIAFCDDQDTNTVTVTLQDASLQRVGPNLDRRGYISQSSCGKEIVADLVSQIRALTQNTQLDTARSYDCLLGLNAHQPLRKTTQAAHAAAIYDAGFQLLAAAEDVGRHNALDKAVGQLVQEDRLSEAVLLTLTSRVSYEMVQKAARAKVPVVLAVSRPTELAVSLADRLGLTIACAERDNGLYIFTHPERLVYSAIRGAKSTPLTAH